MAAPHVAGAAALYMSQYPGATPAVVKAALLQAADPAPCANNIDGNCAPEDPDGIQEPLLMLACADTDGDTVCDEVDNCLLQSNPLQIDTDQDTAGNVCDEDDDNDGLRDDFELQIGSDPLLTDTDGDTLSDYDEVAYDGNPDDYDPDFDLSPLSRDSDDDLLEDNTDPVPLNFNFNDGDLAPLGAPDGVVNAADLLIASRLALGAISQSNLELSHGDLYPEGAPDGIINIQDLILLQNQLQQ
jgi:subtilisin family serine protease